MGVAAQDYQTRRGVAQPGSVLAWGASGRPFKSAHPDSWEKAIAPTVAFLIHAISVEMSS